MNYVLQNVTFKIMFTEAYLEPSRTSKMKLLSLAFILIFFVKKKCIIMLKTVLKDMRRHHAGFVKFLNTRSTRILQAYLPCLQYSSTSSHNFFLSSIVSGQKSSYTYIPLFFNLFEFLKLNCLSLNFVIWQKIVPGRLFCFLPAL